MKEGDVQQRCRAIFGDYVDRVADAQAEMKRAMDVLVVDCAASDLSVETIEAILTSEEKRSSERLKALRQ